MGTLTLHQTSLGFTDIRQLELVLQRSDLGAHTSVTSLVTSLVTPLVTPLPLVAVVLGDLNYGGQLVGPEGGVEAAQGHAVYH